MAIGKIFKLATTVTISRAMVTADPDAMEKWPFLFVLSFYSTSRFPYCTVTVVLNDDRNRSILAVTRWARFGSLD